MSEDRFQAIESRLTAVERVMIREETIGKEVSKRLDKIEDSLTWLVRLMIGTLVTGVLLFVIRGGIAPLP